MKIKLSKELNTYGAFLIITALLCFATVNGYAKSGQVFETDDYWLKVSPAAVTVGEAVRFLFYSDEPVTVSGSVLGQKIRFYQYGKYLRALLGIYPKTAPGEYDFTLEVTAKSGQVTSIPVTLKVKGKKFASTNITLPKKKRKLTSPEKLAPERKKLSEVIDAESKKLFWRERFIMPAQGRLSQRYGTKNLINNELSYHHNGLDIANRAGTTVRAANDGLVILAEPLDVRGQTIIIDHGQGVLSAYFHLQGFAVKPGQMVAKGQKIGYMGQTGMATGPHLHWTTYIHKVPVNPRNFLKGSLL